MSRFGLDLGLGLGPQGGRLVAVTIDPTSGKPVMADAAEWNLFRTANSLSLGTPDYLHNCQEPNGNLADSIGSLALTPLISPAYAQAVTGWSRVGVKGDGSSSQQRFMSASGPNPSTTSIARFAYVQFNGADATPRQIMGCGAVDDVSVSTYLSGGTTNKLRYRESANITDTGATNYTGVHPVMLVSDVTNSRARLYTDVEKLSPTFGLGANATNYSLGSLATGTFANVTIPYACGWQGANAETATDANVKAFFQALGYVISWS